MPLVGLEPTTLGYKTNALPIKLKRKSRGRESNPHFQCQKLTFCLLNYLYNGADGT